MTITDEAGRMGSQPTTPSIVAPADTQELYILKLLTLDAENAAHRAIYTTTRDGILTHLQAMTQDREVLLADLGFETIRPPWCRKQVTEVAMRLAVDIIYNNMTAEERQRHDEFDVLTGGSGLNFVIRTMIWYDFCGCGKRLDILSVLEIAEDELLNTPYSET